MTDSGPFPLTGKRIVVTRAQEQAVELVSRLRSLGAEVLLLPTITFAEAEDNAPLDRAVSDLDKFDWVIFTSRNAIRFLSLRFKVLAIPIKRINHLMLTPRIATIGSATSEEAWGVGFIPTCEAAKSTGEGLASELLGQLRGKRVLLPRSDRADSRFPEILREAGADVVEVVAYRTIAPQSFDGTVVEAIQSGAVDAITLFSPSSYEHFVEEIGLETLHRHSGNIVIASIGPITSLAIKDDGLKVEIEASNASAASLCSAMIDYFRRHPSREAKTK